MTKLFGTHCKPFLANAVPNGRIIAASPSSRHTAGVLSFGAPYARRRPRAELLLQRGPDAAESLSPRAFGG